MPYALPNLLARLPLLFTRRRDRRLPTGTIRLHLPAGSLLRLDDAPRGLSLRCTRGSLWVTQPNDPADHTLNPGQIWHPSRPGTILIQPLTPATIVLRGPVGTPVTHVLHPTPSRRSHHRNFSTHSSHRPAFSPLVAPANLPARPGVVP